MATKIVFSTGRELVVAEQESDVVSAVRRDHPNPVSLESIPGAPVHVNWTHVLFVEVAPDAV
jgi:uncharacterized protein YlzI (FlbEa/FlbD family)